MLTAAAAGAAGMVGTEIILPRILARITPAGGVPSDFARMGAKAALAIAAKMLLGRFVGKSTGNAVAVGVLISLARDVYVKAKGGTLAGMGAWEADGIDYAGNSGGFPYVITDGMGDIGDETLEVVDVEAA